MSRKKIIVISAREAGKLLTASLFNAGGTLSRVKYCTGKYNPETMKAGREVEVPESIEAIYTKSGQDSGGKYVTMWALCK